MNRDNPIFKGIFKRVGITLLCCIPVMILLGFWLQGLNRVALIAIFILFMLVTICIEEYINLKRGAKRELKKKILHKDEDVFK